MSDWERPLESWGKRLAAGVPHLVKQSYSYSHLLAKNVSGIEGGLDVPEQGEDSASSCK